MRGRPKAFFLTAENPYPLVGGGALRSASILEYLLGRYETDVFSFTQPGDANPGPEVSVAMRRARRWTTVALPYHARDARSRATRNLGRLWRRIPPLVDRFRGFEDTLRAALNGERYDVAVVEHFWCAPYGQVLRSHCERMVLDLHNVESLWHERSAMQASGASRWAHRRFATEAARLERLLVPQFDLVLVTSLPEQEFVTNRLAFRNVAIVKNTIPYHPPFRIEKQDEVVFSGNMEYAPNQGAARYFAREIWPLVSARREKTRWKVVGKSAGLLAAIRETAPQCIFVPDPEDAMIEIASAAVAVVPLLVGTGTRLKIVEAWAAGTPVVSTSLGAEGLECEAEKDLLIADDPRSFAEAVVQLLESEPLSRAIAANARDRFEKAYSWESAWQALSALNL